jgi:hypothetical protein
MGGAERAEALVLVVRTRPRLTVYLRSYPRTGRNPTPAQLAARIVFGEAAGRARDVRYAGRGEGLPPAAELVAEALRGVRFEPHELRAPKWVEQLAERLKLEGGQREAFRRRILEALAASQLGT